MALTFDAIARNLRLPVDVVNIAIELVNRREWGEEKPQGIWGAALLTAWNLVKSKRAWDRSAKLLTIDVARAAGVSKSTILSRLRDLRKVLTIEELLWISDPEERLIIRTAQAQVPTDVDTLDYVRMALEAHKKAIPISELEGSL